SDDVVNKHYILGRRSVGWNVWVMGGDPCVGREIKADIIELQKGRSYLYLMLILL
ncbi:hypothetical protein J6590_099779, partial [Homalodisca vitripennis]